MRHGKYPFIVGFLFLPILLYVGLVLWPYAQTFGYSLTDWSGQSQEMNFVGLDNYTKLLGDEVFLGALWHNLLLLAVLPVATILIALFFAFMLNVGGKGGTGGVQGVAGAAFYKVVFFFPQVLSIAILAVLWQAVYRSDGAGLANGALIELGLGDPQHPVEWLNDPNLVLWCIMGVLIWGGVGFYLVLFSAAMQSIPKDIYEAALLDGAKRGQTFFKITLPLLWETIQTAWVYLAIVAMDAFALVASMTPGRTYGGGPDHHSELMSTYLMRNFLAFGEAGYACAMGVVIFFFTLILSVVSLRVTRRERIEY
ncbi:MULTISPECIES: carbohydrate ABC transporter permease [unclassified Kitasatospora]|uniref:carbohydrate ABC transporter permease n=1 Tax=unclassified Kitasatospora TaxID=2633591 RepID=UPI0007112303|nr:MULTISPECIES: sugar ABC transporter permease [unclassified Kitasatospora]KQV05431.1 ABC transporter permease [Kitasatospora sp. Root107]KRB62237.1 ABC transporter permease [Kitasatospora sp. Root187]